MNSEAEIPICHVRGCSISSPNWNQVQQPKYHFIISNVERCKSVKLPLHPEELENCTYSGFPQRGGGSWFSAMGKGSSHGLFGVSGTVFSVTQASSSFLPPCCHCHTNTVIFLVTLSKSKKETTCRFLKSCVWLRKPGVGMQPCNPLTGVERKQTQKGLQMPPRPLPAKFCILGYFFFL